MSTNLKVVFTLSEEFRQRQFVADGQLPEAKQTLELDMSTATPEQRQAIAAYCGTRLEVEIGVWKNHTMLSEPKPYLEKLALDVIPDMDMVVANIRRLLAEKQAAQESYDADCRERCKADLAEKIQALHEHVTERKIGRDYDIALWRYNLADHARRLGVDRSEYDTLRSAYDVMAAERQAEIYRDHEAYKECKRVEAEAKKAERLVWITEHGSEHLKRAVAAGHDCGRTYWRERAAIEYPGYTVDIEKSADWKSRSCPSVGMLDERDAILKAHPEASVEIVWLTSTPADTKPTDEDEDYGEPDQFDECEAIVVVDAPVYIYNLIRY